MVTKHPSADLHARYRTTFQGALAIALALTIVAFKFFPDGEKRTPTVRPGNDAPIEVLIQPTTQHKMLPPPLKRIEIGTTSDVPPDSIDLQLDPGTYIAQPPRFTESDQPEFVEVFEIPEPLGGYSALQKHLVYPDLARRVGREGTVVVLAFIDEAGAVQKTEIKQGIGLGCDEAAAEAVTKTRFHPATQRGKPVKVRVSIPIRFRIG